MYHVMTMATTDPNALTFMVQTPISPLRVIPVPTDEAACCACLASAGNVLFYQILRQEEECTDSLIVEKWFLFSCAFLHNPRKSTTTTAKAMA